MDANVAREWRSEQQRRVRESQAAMRARDAGQTGRPERWFEVWGVEKDDEFVAALREAAEAWPASEVLAPPHTGGWVRDGFLITYADVSDAAHRSVATSFRADFDGRRVLAAEVAPSHVDQGGFFEEDMPLGQPPAEIVAGDPVSCARATAAWYRERLFPQ